jgi:hypothetical protein
MVLGFSHGLWFHAVGLLGYRLGVLGTFEIDGVELRMRRNWFALLAPPEPRPNKPSHPGLLAFKSEWPKFGPSNQIGLSKIDPQEALILRTPGPHILRRIEYPWGTAILVEPGTAAYLPGFDIVVVAGRDYETQFVNALQDIEEIKLVRKPQRLEHPDSR